MVGSQLQRSILVTLADSGPLYVVDIAAAVNEHPLTIEQACNRLHEADVIHPIGCRRYDVTSAGYQQLTDVKQMSSRSDVRSKSEGRS
ncbi:MarR family transcriptional regulator [Natrinema halophilum]|uniref:MarR family transcriptional regulator n=1 Tax=Natrinema halophilum TaxID=1699371 RepID=A0A7D5KYX5_9EURY|nr:MarR family transcriptional regulator [Natrinema halophilum]QLG47920.1 MarR family transcriptional regulator [Natrinema halophilum]